MRCRTGLWTAALAATGMLVLGEAAAEPRAGAPIVFARKEPIAQTASFTVGTPARPPAPVRMAPVTSRPQPLPSAAGDASDELYGYGARRTSARGAIDLRGALAVSAGAEPLPADAFDAAPEAVASTSEEVAMTSPSTPVAAPPRPEWLERERTGAPYQAMGQWYVPAAEPNYAETGEASWYGAEFQGRRTASGEVFDSEALTAAHPTLPIPSLVQVTNLENGREVIVRVNDRGPFHDGRLIDVSRRTAEALGFERKGSARVHVRYLGPAPKRVNADGGEAPSSSLPAVAPPAAPKSAGSDGAYVVQVGAFSDPVNVARARATLQSAGEVLIDARGGSLQRVRVGAWSTREAAEAARTQVASLGYRDAVVALR